MIGSNICHTKLLKGFILKSFIEQQRVPQALLLIK